MGFAAFPVVKIPKYSPWTAHRSPSGTRNTADGADRLNRSSPSVAVAYRIDVSNRHRFRNSHPAAYAARNSVAVEAPALPPVGVNP